MLCAPRSFRPLKKSYVLHILAIQFLYSVPIQRFYLVTISQFSLVPTMNMTMKIMRKKTQMSKFISTGDIFLPSSCKILVNDKVDLPDDYVNSTDNLVR